MIIHTPDHITCTPQAMYKDYIVFYVAMYVNNNVRSYSVVLIISMV